ncbi:hypothetical protein DOQ08_01097 [Marinobacter litoralis]|uniref:Phosphate-selective porin O and P n=1 Tax=Marinobacter litoralis TaxID=187981 RepID=A0A3M2RM34_9GAMM|nr:hypothetical protein [Marinobacter litoralis]RMJ06410.1 hypothetical protein DOQ08_01097 [Marinobacter litoralis]
MRKHQLNLLMLMFMICTHSSAHEFHEAIHVHGFVNQAALYSPDNPYAGNDANNGSVKFREIGLNGYIEFHSGLRFAGQILSRQRDELDDGDVRVDFLLADYLIWSNQYAAFGVRVGRVKNNIGFYNSIRDIPSARPGYNVPDSIYFDAFRDPLLSTDGLNLYGSALIYDNQLTWEATIGRRGIDSEDFEYFTFGYPLEDGDADDVPIYLLNLNFIPSALRDLRLGASVVSTTIDFDTSLSVAEAQQRMMMSPPGDVQANRHRYITAAEFEALLATFSVQYSLKDWILTSEYLHLDAEFDGEIVGSPVENGEKSHGFYVQAEWLATTRTTWLVRYEELKFGDGKSSLEYNPHRSYGKGWTVSGQWKFADDWLLIGQASFNEGTAWLPDFKGIENEQIQKYWNYYVLSLNYQF